MKKKLMERFKGLKEYFLDRLKGYDTAPRFYKKYGAALGLKPMELLMRSLDGLDKDESVWTTQRVFGRCQGATTTVGFISYYMAAFKNKNVLIVVDDSRQYENMLNVMKRYPGFDKHGERLEARIKVKTRQDVKSGRARGESFDLVLVDRTGRDDVWIDVLKMMKEQVKVGVIGRGLELNQS